MTRITQIDANLEYLTLREWTPMMKARNTLVAVAAWTIVLVTTHQVHADPIRWSYYYANIVGDGLSEFGNPTFGFVWAQQPVAGFTSLGPGGIFPIGPIPVTGSSKILVTNLWPFDVDKSPNAGLIPFGVTYGLDVFITDTASGQGHLFVFGGELGGDISPTGYHIGNTFFGGRFPPVQSNTIGGNFYTVSIGPFVAPTGPVDTGGGPVGPPGTISAFVEVAPEPSCLALAGIGLGCLAFSRTLRLVRK
jgi:hypothetical protein